MATATTDVSRTAGLAPATRGDVLREEFGAQEIERSAETAGTAVAARERAAVEAMYIVAMRNPRRWPSVQDRLMKHCERPGFAETARYKRPAGRKKNERGQWEDVFAEGFSIRFAEAALQCMGNIYPQASVVWENDDQRIIRISLTDLEVNLTYATEIVVHKVVERRKLKDGQESIGERKNSYGDTVYLVEATDDEVLVKQNALISKAIRTLGLRLVPSDILEDCLSQIQKTLRGQSPEAQRERIILGFDRIGVTLSDLQTWLGHSISSVTPAELEQLRGIYTAIRENETTWAAALAARQPEGSADAAAEVAQEKLAKAKEAGSGAGAITASVAGTAPAAPDRPLNDEENRALDKEIAARDAAAEQQSMPGMGAGSTAGRGFVAGRKK